MKKINELAQQVINDPTSPTLWSPTKTESKQQRNDVILRLFTSLSIKYGHKWSSYIGDDKEVHTEIENEWARQLGKFDMQQIKKALDVVIDHHPEWPPTIGEFKALCNIGADNWRTDQLALPAKKAQPEVVQSNIEAMREHLR